jgi:hypothetical protein
MNLTATDLRSLADSLDMLAKIDLEIDRFPFKDLTIHVKRTDSQMDGTWLIITEIEK